MPALGGVGVASLLGYSGEVETTHGIDSGVGLGGIVHWFASAYFSVAAV